MSKRTGEDVQSILSRAIDNMVGPCLSSRMATKQVQNKIKPGDDDVKVAIKQAQKKSNAVNKKVGPSLYSRRMPTE